MPEAAPNDNAYNQLVREVLDGWGSASARNRRSRDRRPYPCVQQIARVRDGQFPAKGDFFPVRCFDLSEAGVSFYCDEPLEKEMIVIGLGQTGRLTYLLAEVRHCTTPSSPTPNRYLVGCKFLRRIELN